MFSLRIHGAEKEADPLDEVSCVPTEKGAKR